MTVMIKLRVSASTPGSCPAAARQVPAAAAGPGQHVAASAPPHAELLTDKEFAHPQQAHHPGPYFNDHRSLVGFLRS
jgi:hypothetical protein